MCYLVRSDLADLTSFDLTSDQQEIRCVAVCCSMLQRCSMLQCVAVCRERLDQREFRFVAEWCSVLHGVLQCVAVCYSILQCVAVHSS